MRTATSNSTVHAGADLHAGPGGPRGAGATLGRYRTLIDEHEAGARPRLEMLWSYYRNPIGRGAGAGGAGEASAGERPGITPTRRLRLAQERGLPERLVGPASNQTDDRLASTREIVIENDIAWRIHTMVDFMFGRPVAIVSTARDEGLRRKIERLLDAVWEASGGVSLLADIGLLGHVYGHVDLLVRADLAPGAGGAGGADADLHAAAERIRIEPVEPTRGIPVLDGDDYRRLEAYVIRTPRPAAPEPGREPAREAIGLARWLASPFSARALAPADHERGPVVTEVFGGGWRRVYVQDRADGPARLVAESPALVSAGDEAGGDGAGGDGPPIAHIQNISQPFRYHGLSEVEPLIPLQNELNTRLSDRASRVTMQSFKMLLAKGLDGVPGLSVGPGQVWCTDNPEASIEAFGGDGASPSEESHIQEIREALDKASGVPPLASGVIRAKVGNLTSENALRVTLMGLLSKTARKRVTYGRGLAEACRLVLVAAHRAGVLETDAADRAVRIEWPDPLPRQERDVLDAALKKIELGVPRERVLGELGYAPVDPGIV